jgi:hypothetical protein
MSLGDSKIPEKYNKRRPKDHFLKNFTINFKVLGPYAQRV